MKVLMKKPKGWRSHMRWRTEAALCYIANRSCWEIKAFSLSDMSQVCFSAFSWFIRNVSPFAGAHRNPQWSAPKAGDSGLWVLDFDGNLLSEEESGVRRSSWYHYWSGIGTEDLLVDQSGALDTNLSNAARMSEPMGVFMFRAFMTWWTIFGACLCWITAA